jgi:hypothetical protein
MVGAIDTFEEQAGFTSFSSLCTSPEKSMTDVNERLPLHSGLSYVIVSFFLIIIGKAMTLLFLVGFVSF